MKKVFTLCALAMAIGLSASAQSLKLVANGTELENGAIVTDLAVEAPEGGYMVKVDPHLYVKNVSSAPVDISAYVKSEDGKTEVSFCGFTGTCMNVVEDTRDFAGLQPGAEENFMLDKIMTGAVLECDFKVYAEAYVQTNPEDKAYCTVHFKYPKAGVESTNVNGNYYIGVNDGQLFYNFSEEADRTLNLYSLTGSKVKTVRLEANEGEVSLSNFAKGLYLYEIKVAGKTTNTGKLILK